VNEKNAKFTTNQHFYSMLPAFLRWPAAGRRLHPAANTEKLLECAIAGLDTDTLLCAEGLTTALMRQQQAGATPGSGRAKREAFANMARSFAAETASLPDSEADELIGGLLGVMASSTGLSDIRARAAPRCWHQPISRPDQHERRDIYDLGMCAAHITSRSVLGEIYAPHHPIDALL